MNQLSLIETDLPSGFARCPNGLIDRIHVMNKLSLIEVHLPSRFARSIWLDQCQCVYTVYTFFVPTVTYWNQFTFRGRPSHPACSNSCPSVPLCSTVDTGVVVLMTTCSPSTDISWRMLFSGFSSLFPFSMFSSLTPINKNSCSILGNACVTCET